MKLHSDKSSLGNDAHTFWLGEDNEEGLKPKNLEHLLGGKNYEQHRCSNVGDSEAYWDTELD